MYSGHSDEEDTTERVTVAVGGRGTRQPVRFLPFTQPRTPIHKMVLPTFRMDLPILYKLFYKKPPEIPRVVSPGDLISHQVSTQD